MITAMVVDDSGLMRKILRTSLEHLKVNVVCEASSGEEALALYTTHSPDVVTMDVTMTGIDGVEATRQIIQHDTDARIIMVTAMATNFLLADAYEAGAKGCVVKPFVVGQLSEEIQRVLHDGKSVQHGGL